MNASRAAAVASRLLVQIGRDRRAVALILVVPILIMSLLTVLLKTESKPARVALRADGTASIFLPEIERRLETSEKNPTGLTIVAPDENLSPREMVRKGLADAVLVFPDTFVEERAAGQDSKLTLFVEGADPMKTADIFTAFRKAIPDAVAGFPLLLPEDCDPHCSETIPKAPPSIEISKIYGQNVHETMDFFTPVLPPFFVMFFVFLLSGLTFLRERVSGTAERIFASPLTRTELVVGYILGFLPAAFAQSTVVILFARYALGGPWGGFTVIATILLLTLVAECLGVFVSAYARTEFQVIQFIPIVILPQFLLCGLIWPVSTMPGWLKPLAYALPLTYAVQAVRGAAIRGYSLFQVGSDLFALAGFAALALVLAAVTVKRTRGRDA